MKQWTQNICMIQVFNPVVILTDDHRSGQFRELLLSIWPHRTKSSHWLIDSDENALNDGENYSWKTSNDGRDYWRVQDKVDI